MPHKDGSGGTDGQSAKRKRKRLFHLPEGTRIYIESSGRRTEVDPDSPQGDLAVLGLIAVIAFQAFVALGSISSSSGGIETVTALAMAAAFAVIVCLVVSALRGSGRETSGSLMRIFFVIMLVAFSLAIIQNLDDPRQVITGVLGIVFVGLSLWHFRT